MKIVFIEPNLKSTFGHVFTVLKEIYDYSCIKRDMKNQFYFVCHKDVDRSMVRSFSRIYRLASQSCFEKNSHAGVVSYLKDTIARLGLNSDDKIIFPTAHINEFRAVAKIASEKTPRIFLQIHQFFPPNEKSTKNQLMKLENKLGKDFSKVFKDTNWNRVAIGCTPNNKLYTKLKKLGAKKIRITTVPFAEFSGESSKHNQCIGFLGDTRKEKGPIQFLESIPAINSAFPEMKIIVQITNPRCFSAKEYSRFSSALENAKKIKNIRIIEKQLSPTQYAKTFLSCNLLVMPYLPLHYDMRISGIAIECGIHGMPIVASSGTSIGDWVEKNKLYGSTFKFSSDKQDLSKNISEALKQYFAKKRPNERRAKLMRNTFKKDFSVKEYIKQVTSI